MKRQIVLILICLLNLSCNQEKILLENDTKVNSVFSKDEVKELRKILDFFDSEICEVESYRYAKNYQDCYKSFFERMKRDTKRYGYQVNIPIEKQNELMSSLNPNLRKEIWVNYTKTKKVKISNLKDDWVVKDVETIGINLKGKFMDLLGKMEEEKIKTYLENIRKAGDFSPSLVFGDLIANYETYSISDERIRLFVAIHFLYLNYDTYQNRE